VVTVPAIAWRGGFVSRAVTIGGVVGISLGFLSWLDSGFLLSGVIVLVVVGTIYGIWIARRMARYWPGASQLSGDDRVTVVRAVRSGRPVDDGRLARAVVDYNSGLHAAADQGRPFRWVLPLVLVVSVGAAAWDAVYGSWGNLVASVIYLAALAIELTWWPRRRDRLLANGDRAARL
jgi:hypothetical protein